MIKTMITKKSWSDFRKTGLLLFVNQILHVFGWAIVFDMDGDNVVDIYPARVKFRGFDNHSVSSAYKKITDYISDNITDLSKEAYMEDEIQKNN